jgi:hypothetical protein
LLLIIMILDHHAYCRLPTRRNGSKGPVDCHQNGYLESSLGPLRASNIVKSLALLIKFEAFMRWGSIPKA